MPNIEEINLAVWTKEEVQQWFLSSTYSDYAPKFLSLNGKDIPGLTEAQFKSRCPEMGDVIYNAIQEYKEKNGIPNHFYPIHSVL